MPKELVLYNDFKNDILFKFLLYLNKTGNIYKRYYYK